MMNQANHIFRLLEEGNTLRIGDLVCMKATNLDPVKFMARIREEMPEEGQYRVEFPDQEQGVYVVPEGGPIFIDDATYEEYVENLQKEAKKDSSINVPALIKEINHWIRKRNSSGKKAQEKVPKVPPCKEKEAVQDPFKVPPAERNEVTL